MPLPTSTLISREDYEQLLAQAANELDFAYLGSVGAGNGRGSFSGFTACAIAIKRVGSRNPGGVLNTNKLSAEMESLVQRYEVPLQESLSFLTGGWVGFLSYEFGYQKEPRLSPLCPAPATPLLFAGFYLWAASHNRATDTYHLWVHPECPNQIQGAIRQWLSREPRDTSQDQKSRMSAKFASTAEPWKMVKLFAPRQSASEFVAGVGTVKDYIDAGDCYQVNLSQEFRGSYEGNPWQAFKSLAEANPTPYSAFLKTGTGAMLSISPERFLEIRGRSVKTSPIKGTRPRGKTSAEDTAYAAELEASEKDRAENLMIVDLLRNDLSLHATAGSVTVDSLFALESYPNVHHLVSHIRAELAEGVSPLKALFDAFPGGSITGAPKIRAMEIIRELEPHWRGPYCGSIFYYGLDGTLDSNIAIRTMLCENEQTDAAGEEHGTIRCWGGGGIVADSDPESEYQETLTKVKPLMDFLEKLNQGEC
ncbi:aminodeoxychorismate synthase component I [Streptosporangium jomthongense]|uniref:Aminodeoxychorismate synthase component I n=1 Tax=Marinobacter aromaticivorans TaxID=1494078 RepID=A0ABW2IWS2_9GAMM|nr:aminodeoxychorismate synthase component I [Marinobacter aromaticivorans]GGE72562.1 aminodeoxychorismate synthase component I [Streptosporangium jomthongense]